MTHPAKTGFLHPDPLQPEVRLRYGCFSPEGAPKGTVVLLGGRGEFIEKYDETIEALNDRGFMVWSMDWRGQGLSTRLLPERHKGHIDTYQTYLQDFHHFVQTRIITGAPRPLILLAHSMGGHLGLRYLREHQGLFTAAILSAPMVDIHTSPYPRPVLRALAFGACAMGLGSRFAPGQHPFSEADRDYSQNRLTHDPERFQRSIDWFRTTPELALGGVTFGWIRESLKSIETLRRQPYAEGIPTPVLLVDAGDEAIVSSAALRELAEWMPRGEVLSIPGSRHEILQEVDRVQATFWSGFDDFLKREAGI